MAAAYRLGQIRAGEALLPFRQAVSEKPAPFLGKGVTDTSPICSARIHFTRTVPCICGCNEQKY